MPTNSRNAGRPPVRLVIRRGDTVLLNKARFTVTTEGKEFRLITQRKPYDARWNVLIEVAKQPDSTMLRVEEKTNER